jgi:L-ribulose-5-phosphate 3-epimerase
MCSFDTGNFVTYSQDVLAAYDLLSDKIRSVHLKDRSLQSDDVETRAYVCEDGTRYYPAAVGFGCMPIEEVLWRLQARNYTGSLIIEIFDSQRMLLNLEKSILWLREKWPA